MPPPQKKLINTPVYQSTVYGKNSWKQDQQQICMSFFIKHHSHTVETHYSLERPDLFGREVGILGLWEFKLY